MSLAWISIKNCTLKEDANSSNTFNNAGDVQSPYDETSERRIFDIRRRYDQALISLSSSSADNQNTAEDQLMSLVHDIDPLLPYTSELGMIRYLSLKNYSQIMEKKQNIRDAITYALQALSYNDCEINLLLNICNFLYFLKVIYFRDCFQYCIFKHELLIINYYFNRQTVFESQ